MIPGATWVVCEDTVLDTALMSPHKILWNVLAVVRAEQGRLCLCYFSQNHHFPPADKCAGINLYTKVGFVALVVSVGSCAGFLGMLIPLYLSVS